MTQSIALIDGQRYHAVSRLIDSVWTVVFTVQDGHAFIESYDRDNAIGYEQEKTLPKVRVIEDDQRHIQQLDVYAPSVRSCLPNDPSLLVASLPVANPQYVFSYK